MSLGLLWSRKILYPGSQLELWVQSGAELEQCVLCFSSPVHLLFGRLSSKKHWDLSEIISYP